MSRTSFPEGFLWGAATAAHQVEGGNVNSDWWAWEHAEGTPCLDPSGDACDHWNRFRDDIAMLADLGLRSYRFSIEWARIEPAPGEYSKVALAHYADVLSACHEHGVEPCVTLNHFTIPQWVAARGGWTDGHTAMRFAEYAAVVGDALGEHFGKRIITINEPNIVATMGYQAGYFPPGEQDDERRKLANDVLVEAHRRGTEAVRAAAPGVEVGLALAMAEWTTLDDSAEAAQRKADEMEVWEDVYLRATDGDDFIGVNTYSRYHVGADGMGLPEGLRLTAMGWEWRPEALAWTCRRAHEQTGLPVLVTESGLSTHDDTERVDYYAQNLTHLAAAIEDGTPIVGFTAWSLMDNFEWALGYGQRFGIVHVDYDTLQRTPKPSAHWLGDVARANALPA